MLPKVDWKSESIVAEAIRSTKKELRLTLKKEFKSVWGTVLESIEKQKQEIKKEIEKYGTAIPIINIEDILNNTVPQKIINRFLKRGAVVIRNVISKDKVIGWYNEVKKYLEENDYYNQKVDPNLDTYFSSLKSGKPQIFNIFWSKCQVNIRQHENLARVKAFLNSFWVSKKSGKTFFVSNRETAYADRIRIRDAGDATLGLSPHVDGGSIERWLDDANLKVYKKIFSGDWQDYHPYDGEYRNQVENIPSPAVCRAFRTYQSWIALSPQGPGDGTLQLVPMIKESTAYLLLRPFVNDVPEEIFCGGSPGRAQSIDLTWHKPLLEGLISIPHMEPGDTVWWHADLVHAVEDEHKGNVESSVTYVGSAPWCERNQHFLELQKPCFLNGKSSPDFAPENREEEYINRATLDDLTSLGKKQMGFLPWK